MITDAFEWDDAKASSNFHKHGISFQAASLIFDDPMAVIEQTTRKTMVKTGSSPSGWQTTS